MANALTQIIISAVDRTKAAFASAKAGLSEIGSLASGLRSNLAGIFTGLSLLGFVGQVKGAINAMDEAGKAAQKVGTSVEKFSALTFAASQSDVSIETLQKSLAKLALQLDAAKTGSGAAAEAFKRINIDPRKFDDPADALVALAERFASMPDGVNKSALAMQIFGKAGADMIPLLNQGREGIVALTEEAKKLGVVFSEEAALAAEQLNDNLDKLRTAGRGASAALATELVGPLTQITNAMTEAAKDAGLLKAAWVGLGGLGAALFTNDLETLEQRLRRLKEEFDEATTGLFTDQDQADAISRQIRETENLIEAEREAFRKRRDESKKTADDLGENREQETREFKASINEQIKDSERLQSALQAAFATALKTEQDYLREARRLRSEASQVKVDQNDAEAQAAARLEAIIAQQKLQRIAPTEGLENVREQADMVRELASQLNDAALKADLLKQANLAEAAALEKAAAAERERAAGLADQQQIADSRLASIKDQLAILENGAVVEIRLGESAKAANAELDAMISKVNYLNTASINPGGAVAGDSQSQLARDVSLAAVKHGRRP
jgi:hypothetical protein